MRAGIDRQAFARLIARIGWTLRPAFNILEDCWKICPAGAIAPEKKPLCFDYGRCIRCYCCIEVCPVGALDIIETITGRIFRGAASLILPPGKTK